MRFRKDTPLESKLRASRAEPSKRLVDSVVGMVRPQHAPRPARMRLAFAGALTVALVAVAGATGGFSYAATAITKVASVVHISGASKPSQTAAAPACSQYSVAPQVTNIYPTLGQVGSQVEIHGSNFLTPDPVTAVYFRYHVAAAYTIDSDTQITATVPAGAHSGKIAVVNCAGVALSPQTFTIVYKKPCTVPSVVGDKLSVAKQKINAAHCTVGKITPDPRNHQKPPHTFWYVTQQKPQPGKVLVHGSPVNLWITAS
jgi:hypothetical protein